MECIPIHNQENYILFRLWRSKFKSDNIIIKTDGKSLIEQEMGSFNVL